MIPSVTSHAMPRFRLLGLVLFLGTLAAFSQAVGFGFLNYDDPNYVTENPVVLGGIGPDGVARAFRTPVMGNYHPVTMLELALEWHFFQGDPAAFHLSGLLWHCANAVLALLFFRSVGCTEFAAFLAAALFAWHPLRVESVVWISERKDVLSGFFFLVALLLYLQYLRGEGSTARKRTRYVAALGAFVVGLLCKPMLLTVPGVLFLLDLHHQRSEPTAHSSPATSGRRPTSWVLRALIGKIPFLAISAVFLAITMWTQRDVGAKAEGPILLSQRCTTALAALPQYLAKILWPGDLAPLYPLPTEPDWAWASAGIALLLGSLALCLQQWRRRPWLAIGWLWFLGMLVPVLGFVQVGVQAMADRYTYLPSLGLCLIAGLAFDGIVGRLPSQNLRRSAVGTAILVLVAYACATTVQVYHWRDSAALWEHTVAHTGPNPIARFALGNAYTEAGRLLDAERELKTAVALAPRYFPARNNLGTVLALQGRTAEALVEWEIVAAAWAGTPHVHLNLARLLISMGRYDEALAKCRWISTRWPGLPAAEALRAEASAGQARLNRQARSAVPPQPPPATASAGTD